MPDWDENSRVLAGNLAGLLGEFQQLAESRAHPTLDFAKTWHRCMLKGLALPDKRYAGAFRGENGLENLQVKVGASYGVDSSHVADELKRFEKKLLALIGELDRLLPAGREPNADQLAAVVDTCAWVHSEWARIHPFANGNGRIARLWANFVAIRYGLPPFIRLRPRPGKDYAVASARAMKGDWLPTAKVFRGLLDEFLAGP